MTLRDAYTTITLFWAACVTELSSILQPLDPDHLIVVVASIGGKDSYS